MNNSMKNEKSSMNATPYYSEDGTKIAVLLTSRYGAGWSSWYGSKLAYDKRIVEWWIKHHDNDYCLKIRNCNTLEYKEFSDLLKKWGYDNKIYTYGYGNIILQWIDRGRAWQIKDYDGKEYIIFADEQPWNSF